VPAVRGRHERLTVARIEILKSSGRETHLEVTLTEGKNRELRRLFEAVAHEVTRVHRITFGGVTLGRLQPGEWREVSLEELFAVRPQPSLRRSPPRT
jgi:23S rRNA pseudouridine2605 synthase